jgi:hypothetical protein
MPSLQFDSQRDYDTATKQQIAQEMGRAYARIMQAAVELVTVSIHDLGPGKVDFTRHPGDDMYHPHLGGVNHDRTATEGQGDTDARPASTWIPWRFP